MTRREWPPRVSPPSAPFVPLRRGEVPTHTRSDEEVDEIHEENERRRLERLLATCTKELDELEKQIDLRTPRNRRYNVNFAFDWVNQPTPAVPIYVDTQSAVINTNTRFYAMALEVHYQLQVGGATFGLGPVLMRKFFNFEWRIRDTGSDRAWTSTWMPSDFLYSGDVCGLLTPEAPALLSGNASIEVDVRVIRSANSSTTGSFFNNPEKHLLQVSFVGIEVPE